MASYQSGSSLEVCHGHKREQSQDSGAYIDWNSEDSSSPVSNPDSAATDDFITVVAVENGGNGGEKANDGKKDEASFVTILAIGDTEGKSQNIDVEEEVLVYRLPGERLGFGLKFEGGTNTAENVKRLFIQSSVPDSPASRAKCSWGSLVEGDEIIKIDGNVVKTMTRLDCVRCLKESSVVIKLYVRHRENKTIQQSNRVKLENHNEVRIGNALSSSSSSPTVVSAEMKKNVPPPPPPVPPRKIARKSPPSTFPKESLEGSSDLQNPTPKTRTIQNGCEDTSKNSSKHIIRVPQKGGQDSPEMTKHSLKRNGSDQKIAPPEPKVYLDLLAQEESRNCESESDDTCSTVSTVVGLSSVPTTTNSSFSDLRSSASSFCDSTNPSTPTSEPTTPVLELSKVLSPFEHSQNNEFLFSKLINYKDQDGVNYDEKISTCSDDIAPLQPPLSFQDAPLSYGNEDMLTNMSENLRIYNDENSGNSIKNLTDEVTSTEYDSSGDGKFKDKNQNLTKKPSLIPRLAKTIGLLSPPKPSPRKESKGDGSKSRFNKKKPPPPPFPVSSQNGIVEQTENKIKSSIPYLKKKKNKHTGKAEKKSKYPEDATPKVEISLPIELQMQQPNDLVIENQDEGDGKDRNVPEMPKTPESDKKLTWEVPDLKNLTDNKVNGKPETGDQKHDVAEVESEKFLSETKSECDNDAVDETSDSHFVFPWSKHLETIGEDEEDSTVEETFTDGCVENIKKDVHLPEPEIKTEQKSAGEELDAEGEANEEETEKTADKFGENSTPTGSSKSIEDESERNSPKHKNNLCDNQILVNREVDNDTLEVVENGDLNTSNGELKEAMVPVVSTAIGLIATNSNFNRMPPDGHEFPQKYTEKPLLEKSPMTVKILNGSESEVSDSALPPLPSSEPPSSAHRYQSLVNGESDILSNRKYYGEVAATTKPPRNSFWRQDEKSEKSVRDKIAMFSSVPDSGTSPTNGSGKLSKYKSSDDVFNCDETDCSRNIQNGKHFSRSVITLDKVAGGSPYLKKSSYSDASVPPRSLDFSNRTQSSMDLTSSASSAYSSSCSPDSSLSSNSSYLGYSSTLPRKKTRSGTEEGKNDRDKKDASVHRTTSFSVHGRSQSLLDVNPTPYRSRYLSETSQEEGQKPGSLNLLIEQRRKNLSKLRGLVIPEKLSDSRSNQPIVDLPEIRSRDLILNAKMPTFQKEKTTTATAKWTRPIVPEVVGPKVTPTHLWDMQNKTPNIPKYSPAFKRKSISVFGAKEVVPLTTKKEISSLSLSDAPKAPLKPPRNAPTVRQNSVSDDKKYQDAVTSILCETEISYPLEKNHRMNEITRTTDVYSPKRKSVLQGKYRLHSDTGRSEEDSDNDSAVSSSRSSISHGFSPPASPLLDNQYQNDDSSIRNGVRLSPDRNPLARSLSMETSSNVGSHLQGNVGGLDANGNDPSNRRILKPQSVEAINRKNVLTSAKYSRGFDVKSGSPLIQRKFSEETVEDVNKHSSLPYRTTQQTMYSTRKYTTNGVEAPKDHHRQIEKIAYITDVVDAPIMSEVISKRKLEKSESVPLPPAIKPERAVTTRKASVPFEYSWGKEGTWNQGSNKSNEQVPVNSKESASLDKPTEKTVTSDREYGYSSLKLKVNRIPGENGVSLNGSIESRAIEKGEKPKVELKSTQNGSERLQNGTTQPVSVNDIRRAFEKPETSGQTTGKMTKTGSIATPPNFNSNGLNGNHIRVSSFDSTTSDDGPYGFSSNLLREQFGSITSLASSTSLISPQELQLLIEEANQTLEESGSLNGGSSSNNHDVLVIILHRDTVGGSIGITLAGGADYESKEITVHKVLAGSPADRDGRLQKGDRILSINGKSMKGVTHRESLAILKSPRLEVVLVVSRLKPDAGSDTNNSDDSTSVQVRNSFVTGSSRPSRIIKQSTLIESDESSNGDVARGPPVTLALVKDGAGLGFSLEGGKDCSTGDRPLLIKKIFTGGSAEKCGQLRAGDELVNINGIDVSVMSRIDAWKMMKQLPDGNVTITVKRAVENVRT